MALVQAPVRVTSRPRLARSSRRNVSARAATKSEGSKKPFDFWAWMNKVALKDSREIGAGYEDSIKDGRMKDKKKAK